MKWKFGSFQQTGPFNEQLVQTNLILLQKCDEAKDLW